MFYTLSHSKCQTNGLASTTDTYHNTAAMHLSSTQQATQAVVQQGARDDAPTGTTPRKRVWQYVDQWELTKNRDELLKAWRERGISGVGSETFAAEHLPLPEDEEDSDRIVNLDYDMAVDDARSPTDTRNSDEPEGIDPLESPIAVSLASSASSSSMPIPAHTHCEPPALASKKTTRSQKSGLPIAGTLTDRPTNVLARPRRAR